MVASYLHINQSEQRNNDMTNLPTKLTAIAIALALTFSSISSASAYQYNNPCPRGETPVAQTLVKRVDSFWLNDKVGELLKTGWRISGDLEIGFFIYTQRMVLCSSEERIK